MLRAISISENNELTLVIDEEEVNPSSIANNVLTSEELAQVRDVAPNALPGYLPKDSTEMTIVE